MFLQSRGTCSRCLACFFLSFTFVMALDSLQTTTIQAQEYGGDQLSLAPMEQDPLADDMIEHEPPQRRQESYLSWLYRSLGISFRIGFLVLFTLLGLWFFWCLPTAMRDSICPTHLVRQVSQSLAAGQESQARDLVNRSQASLLGRALGVGLVQLSDGSPIPSVIVQRAAELEEIKLLNRLNYLLLLTVLAAIFGAIGTVNDLTVIFFRIAYFSGLRPLIPEIADGISTSFVRMMVGLLPAFPMSIAYCVLRNRCRRLSAEARLQAEMLLLQFAAASGKATIVG